MSRVAKKPVTVPAGVDVVLSGLRVEVKGPRGAIELRLNDQVHLERVGDQLTFAPKAGYEEIVAANALAGTTRALLSNMMFGVTQGFVRKLLLVGVGFRAQAQGGVLNLALGFSHPVKFVVPDGVTIETPSQTEVVIKGADKRLVGQVAAKIRAYRPPEPYKGKGVRYEGEVIVQKEGKKK